MIKYDVGVNAGIIWHLLSQKGALSYNQIKEATNFDIPEIMLALGWLSREDKISFCSKGKDIVVSLCHYNFYF